MNPNPRSLTSLLIVPSGIFYSTDLNARRRETGSIAKPSRGRTMLHALAVAIFLRAANVGGHNTFSTTALAKKLDLVNIGAAGTFVAHRPVGAPAIARELPFETDVIVRPGAEVLALVKAGRP